MKGRWIEKKYSYDLFMYLMQKFDKFRPKYFANHRFKVHSSSKSLPLDQWLYDCMERVGS